jgi:hypothetical protein
MTSRCMSLDGKLPRGMILGTVELMDAGGRQSVTLGDARTLGSAARRSEATGRLGLGMPGADDLSRTTRPAAPADHEAPDSVRQTTIPRWWSAGLNASVSMTHRRRRVLLTPGLGRPVASGRPPGTDVGGDPHGTGQEADHRNG